MSTSRFLAKGILITIPGGYQWALRAKNIATAWRLEEQDLVGSSAHSLSWDQGNKWEKDLREAIKSIQCQDGQESLSKGLEGKNDIMMDFPGGLIVKTLCFPCCTATHTHTHTHPKRWASLSTFFSGLLDTNHGRSWTSKQTKNLARKD